MTTPPHLHDRQPSPSHLDGPRSPQGSAEIALDYARRMFERQHVPLPPLGFQVDWADQPSRHKVYLDTVKVPLPEPFRSMARVGVAEAVRTATGMPGDPPAPRAAGVPSLEVLAAMLGCGGLVDRRTEPNWNDDAHAKIRADQAVWARPTASGGGMYPTESYLVVGPAGPLPPGVYHYDTAHHSLDRLHVGDHCAALAAATGVRAGLYAVITLRFWKNAFKYNSFSYHVVTQDAGALLASWRLVLAACGTPVEPVLWFDESVVSDVLDVDGHGEAPFIVVPFGHRPDTQPPAAPTARLEARVSHPVWERSRRVRSFELVSRVHLAALVGDRPRPGPDAAQAGALPEPTGAAGDDAPDAAGTAPGPAGDGTRDRALPLPEAAPRPTDLDVAGALLARRTSFGLLSARPPLDAGDLSWVLSAVAQAGRAGTDVAPSPRAHAWTGLHVLANSVTGLEQRAYRFDPARNALVPGAAVDVPGLQRLYALANYSLPEVAAVVVITGRLDALVAAYGARGYRMLSIEVGQAAQTAYLAATARGLGVGAVLGMDNIAIDELLGIAGSGERSMLFLLLGHERTPRLGYDHALYRRTTSAGTAAGPAGAGQV